MNKHPSREELINLFEYKDGQFLWRKSPRKNVKEGNVAGNICKGRCRIKIKNKNFGRNRLVWIYFNGDIPENLVIDHDDGNTLNDRIENLKMITQQENMIKQKTPKTNKSGYRGVYLDDKAKVKKWIASIRVNGKTKTLGSFLHKEEAALAYNNAASLYFGDFAVLNDIISLQ